MDILNEIKNRSHRDIFLISAKNPKKYTYNLVIKWKM